MEITRFGRLVFIAQWVMVLALPLWVVAGRAALGVELGWMGVIGIVYSPVMIVALLLPPLVSLFDAEVRRAKAERSGYSRAMVLAWAATFFAAFALPDADDDGALDSALTAWTGMSELVSSTIALALFAVAGVALVVALVLAIRGIARSRSAANGTAPS